MTALWLVRLTLVGALVASVACSSGDGAGDGEASGIGGVDAAPRTPRTEPSATTPEAVVPYVEDLLARYDQVVNQIIADPEVATDPDHRLVEQYLSLFEPDSQFAEDALAAWADSAETRRVVEPYSEDHPAYAMSLDGEPEVVNGDEVGFPVCIERRLRVYEEGVLRQETPYFAEPGAGVAVRVDGTWRLSHLDRSVDLAGCRLGTS
jgi:hypothetical protein